jgi:HK97 family phage major capsid protein
MTAPTTIAPVPKNSDELAEALADPGRYKDILASRENLQTFINAYAQQHQSEGTDLHRKVSELTQKALTQFLKDKAIEGDGESAIRRLNLDPQTGAAGMRTSHRQGTSYNRHAPGAILDKEFKDAVDFFRTTWHANVDPKNTERLARIRNAYSSVVPADGGFLVPETLRAQLLSIALEEAVVRPRATVIPMETARVAFPMIDVTSNASSVFGGMIAYWAEESAALTASQAKFGRIVLDSNKLTGLAITPSELIEDSLISFAALIETLWPRTLAFEEDDAFMTGSGADKPLGLVSNSATIAVAKEAGQAAATIVYENVIKAYSRMLPSSLSRAVWLCSPDVLPQLFTMALSVGTGGSAVMINNAAGPVPMTIFGRPLIVTEKANTLGAQGDLIFADLSYYLVGDRQLMTSASSIDYRFGNDQTTYRIIQRVDGRPWIKSAITPRNGGNTLSPFVEIAVRS